MIDGKLLTILGLSLDIIGFYFLLTEVLSAHKEQRLKAYQKKRKADHDSALEEPHLFIKQMLIDEHPEIEMSEAEIKETWDSLSEDEKSKTFGTQKFLSELKVAHVNALVSEKVRNELFPYREKIVYLGAVFIILGFVIQIIGAYIGNS